MPARAVRGMAVAVVVHLLAAAAAAEPAVVQGAGRLYVREGPGTEYRRMATLPEGAEVEAIRLQGRWAELVLPDGRRGFAHSRYLAFPRGAPPERPGAGEPAAEMLAAAIEPTPTGETPAAEAPAGPAAENGDGKEFGRKLDQIVARLERIERKLAAPAPAVTTPQPLPGEAQGTEPQAEGARFAGWGWILLGLGLGWVMGSAWGRHQERNRRARVRV